MSYQSLYGLHSSNQRPIRIETLGGPRFSIEGSRIQLGPKAASLLAVVAYNGETGVDIEQLYELLWSSGSNQILQKRMGHFRRTISASFGDFDPLVWDANTVRVNPAHASSDLTSLSKLLRSEQLTAAAKLVAAGFLPYLKVTANAHLTSWINLREAELRDDVRQVAAQVRSSAIGRADWDLVVDTSSALLLLEPHDQDLLVVLLQDLARIGRPEEAYLAYRAFSDRNQAKDPAWRPRKSTLEALHGIRRLTQVSGHGRLAYRPLRENRPPFVGREAELRELRILLSETECTGFRIVCVSGQAGSGRSRLVDEALRAVSPSRQTLLRFSHNPAARTSEIESDGSWRSDLEWLPQSGHQHRGDPIRTLEVLVEALSDILTIREDVNVAQDAIYSELVAAVGAASNLIVVIDDFELAPTWIQDIPILIQQKPILGSPTVVLITYEDFDPIAVCASVIPFPLLQIAIPLLGNDHLLKIVSAHPHGKNKTALETRDILRVASGRPGMALSLMEHGLPLMEVFEYQILERIPVSIRWSLLKRLDTLSTRPLLVLEIVSCASGFVQPRVIQEILNIRERDLESSFGELAEKGLVETGPKGARISDRLLALVLRATLPSTRRIRISRELSLQLMRECNVENRPKQISSGPHLLKLAKYHFILGDIEQAKTEALAAARSDLEFTEYESCLRLLQVIAENSTELVPSVSYEIASLLARLDRPDRAQFHFREAERKFRLRGESKRSLQAGLMATRSSLRLPDASQSEAENFLETAFSMSVRRGWCDLAAQVLEVELRLADSEFRFKAAGKTLERADRLRRSGSSPEVGKIKLDILRSLGVMFGRRDECVSIGWDAVNAARNLGSLELHAEATNSLMASLLYLGKLETTEGERLLAYLAGPASRGPTDQTFRLLSRMNRAVWAMDTWDYELAMHLLAEELKETALPQTESVGLVRLNHAIALYQLRRIPEAEKELRVASERLGPRPSSAAQVAQAALSGLIALERGSLERAGRHRRQLETLGLHGPFDPTLALELHARWFWYHGQKGSAIGLLDDAIDGMGSSTPLYRASAWEILARLYEKDESPIKAENARREALRIAEELNIAHLTWRLIGKLRHPRDSGAR
jgi:DNA-binding SARP family transcriptional activator/tetratricopeptide (TPR) repeat protein